MRKFIEGLLLQPVSQRGTQKASVILSLKIGSDVRKAGGLKCVPLKPHPGLYAYHNW